MIRSGRHAVVVLALVLAVGANTVVAQVNTERLRADASDPGLAGGLGSSLSLKRGNTDFLQVSGSAWSQYRWGVQTLLAHTRAAFGEQNGERFAGNAFGHLRWTAMWLGWVGPEVFAQIEHDDFRLLQLRLLAGTGPRFALIEDDMMRLYLGTAYMVEYERLDVPPTEPHPVRTVAHRSSNYVALSVRLEELLRLSQTLYVQPRFDRPSDTRVLEELELAVEVSDVFKLTTAVRFRVDTDPPTTVEEVDFELTNGFELRW